jgi:glucose-1-phosphate thymidylyltransferase
MKGIVLAGGTGSRLWPATLVVSKQLIPLYDKPLIYYPLSTLMLAEIRDILIIVAPDEDQRFRKLLGDGAQWGLRISYAVQEKPRGRADAFVLGKNFIDGDEVCLILGDNLFHGQGLGRQLSVIRNIESAHIFAYQVSDPQNYGVVVFDEGNQAIGIVEKPDTPQSNWVIPGLYFYPNSVCELAAGLAPSARGEIEISELNQKYLERGELQVTKLERGTVWLDTGSSHSLLSATNFVSTIQERQGLMIGCPEEIAYDKGWITKVDLQKYLGSSGKNSYSDYLRNLLQ